MSKIKTQRMQARFDDSTLVIGLDGTGHTTRFEGHVVLPQYVTKEELEQLLLGYNSIYKYITRQEFKDNSNKVYIQDEKPVIQDPDDPWEFDPRDGDIWFDSKLDHVMIFQTINDVGDWRKPQFAQDIDDLKEDVLELAGELEAVIRTAEKGVWNTGGSAPYPGEITIMPVRLTDPEITVFIHNEDKDGKTHTFADVQVGTWIELVEDDEDFCLGKITAIADTTGKDYLQATVEVSTGKGEAKYQSTFRVRFFEADADVDLSSMMPKAGGAFTGNVTWNGCDIVSQPIHPDHLFTSIYSNRPRDANNVVQSGEPFGVKVEIGSGNTYRNRFIVANGSTDLFTVQGGGTGKVEIAREAHYTTSPKTSYADKEIPHWKGVKDWATGQFQAKGDYNQKTEKLGSGYEKYFKYVSPRSLGEQQFSMSSSRPSSASYAYLYRLYDYYNRLISVKDFYRTHNTMLEIWEQDTGTVVMRKGVTEYGTSQYSTGDVYLTMHSIWALPGYEFSGSKNYCILLSHMVRK